VFDSRHGTIIFGAISASLCTALTLTIAANMLAFGKTVEDDAQIAKSLATMLRAGRAVISRNQDRINDPNTGNKGLRRKDSANRSDRHLSAGDGERSRYN
jgi:hypothetical protein